MSTPDQGVWERHGEATGTVSSDRFRVLHVDDDPSFADLVGVYLERESDALEVVTEHSAADGLDRLETGGIDCVVSDFEMPGMDGLEFLESVREGHPDLPFLLFTGKGSEDIASRAISKGVTDYLQKGGGTDQYTVLANRVENATRRHHAEQAVERGFQALETAREGIAFLDEEGRIVYVNGAYAETYGYERTELVGQHWEVLYPDEHVDWVYDELLPSIPETGRWTGENVHLRRDGSRLLVDHALAYTDEGMLLCLIQDITEQKERERALERERQRFELFVDAVEEYAIFALDPDGFVTSWNRGAERLKGYDEADIIGQHFSVFYPEEKAEAGYPAELLATATEERTVEDAGWRVREDGSEFWAEVVITAVFDEDDRHRGFLKVTRDATEERRAREEPAAEKSFIERALDVLDDVFYVLNPAGEIVRVTDRASQVTGYSREELLSMSPLELFDPDDRAAVRADIEEALETGESRLEVDLVTADGRRVPFEFRKRRLTDPDGEAVGIAGVGRDITERRRRERQLERQLSQFEEFGSVLAHDLRSPLDAALGRLELARETNDPEHLDRAEAALDRLDSLIEDLAGVMREGELVDETGPVPVGDCARSAWASVDAPAATLRVVDDVTVRADEGALTRMLENLLNNAVAHGGSEVTVTVGRLHDGFYVADDGPGIPEDERERVFEPGYSTDEDGSGLGLASARQIVVAHGWAITATGSADGGARFEVTEVEVVETDGADGEPG